MTFPYIVDIKLYPVKSSGCSPRRSKCDLRPLSAHKTAESRKSVRRNKFLPGSILLYSTLFRYVLGQFKSFGVNYSTYIILQGEKYIYLRKHPSTVARVKLNQMYLNA